MPEKNSTIDEAQLETIDDTKTEQDGISMRLTEPIPPANRHMLSLKIIKKTKLVRAVEPPSENETDTSEESSTEQ